MWQVAVFAMLSCLSTSRAHTVYQEDSSCDFRGLRLREELSRGLAKLPEPSLSVAVSSVIIFVVLCCRLALLDSAESPTWVNLRLQRSLLVLRR
ncbi:hypothetical protein MRX96_043272 [Rhipicephalus microplus]